MYGHCWQFITARSDESYSQSPFVELAIFTRFIQANNKFFISSFAWNDYYRTIFRSNQVLDHVPGIDMDGTLKSRLLAEARFVRALMYFDLESFFGNVPLITTEVDGDDPRARRCARPQVQAQVITDLLAAIPDLPADLRGRRQGPRHQGRRRRPAGQACTCSSANRPKPRRCLPKSSARANTRWCPTTWTTSPKPTRTTASRCLRCSSSGTSLDVGQGQDNASAPRRPTTGPTSSGLPSIRFPMCSPAAGCLTSSPTRRWPWRPAAPTSTGLTRAATFPSISSCQPRPVLRPDLSRAGLQPQPAVLAQVPERPHPHHAENFTSGINFRLIRYADVLLLQAEALNEQGQHRRCRAPGKPGAPAPSWAWPRWSAATSRRPACACRCATSAAASWPAKASAGSTSSAGGLLDDQAGLDDLKTRDADFSNFVLGKSKLLPIPQTDIDIDPNIKQNPGY